MLHGRRDTIAAIDDLVGGLAESRSGALVLRGEPGVGKSTVLEYAAQRATPIPVLRATGVQSEVRLPFAALHQLLYPVVERIDGLTAPQAAALRGALGLDAGRGEDRFLVAVATLTLLADVAAEDGVLCLVDDAHWLDPASAEVLAFAARRLEAEGVGMLFAARNDPALHLDGAGLGQHQLGGLDEQAAAELLDDCNAQIAPPVRERLIQLTGGNPLALVEAASTLTPDQLAGRQPLPDPLPLGANVERIFAGRADGLSDDGRALLLLAAADDTGVLSIILEAAAGMGVPAAALEEVERAGLVTVVAPTLRFRHPLVRSAVYHRAPFGDRQTVHRALAAALGADGGDQADRRAWHLAAATPGRDETVAAELETAAQRALRRGGSAAAAAALERAAAVTPVGSDRGRRLLAAAAAAWDAGQPTWAQTLIEQADPLVADGAERARLLHLQGVAELRCATPHEAYALLMESAAAAGRSSAALATLVLAGEAAAAAGDPEWTVAVGALAESLPAESDTDTLQVALLTGAAAMLRGDLDAGAERLGSVVERAGALTDPEQLLWAGRAALYLGDEAIARRIYDRAITRARTAGAVGLLASLLARVAMSDAIAGRADEAINAATEALQLGDEAGFESDNGIALFALTLASAVRGEEGECRASAERAQTVAAARSLAMIADGVRWSLGLLELGLGRPADALSRFQTPVAVQNDRYPMRFLDTPDLVESAVRSGQPDACRTQFEAYDVWSQKTALPARRALVARCHALLADGDEALSHYEMALGLHDRSGGGFQHARTRLLYGEALRRRKQRSQARPQLRSALETFERLGAHPWAERARTELRATGETARKRDPSTLDKLTPQELQIARLAAQGHSNREIGAQLFVSPRTVEYHLHKVFTKLGITARGQLMRLDLDPPP